MSILIATPINPIPPIYDAKGDIIVGTGPNDAQTVPVGSSGQVLSADPAQATGVRWITIAGAGGGVAADTIYNAKGDLPVGTGSDTAQRLPVGTDGQHLIADSAADTGMSWSDDLPTFNTQTGASYTLVAADARTIVGMNNAGANTLTVPTDATVNFPVGTQISIRQVGAGQTTIAAAGGVTLRSRGSVFKLAGQWAYGTLVKVAVNTWELTGDISA